mmetsp:Transcript_7295/g.11448  ORF Transcript_7295/g.11448 Transcript_7295/m.11448 type:complete len:123 (+) Transcript_7295:244-612(+)|eukprot:CAMPEP_0170502580 /NCGR_PEP_ID=MMETSP0208-20121228/41932_1 /TAXON_ID=197538 /ORGANISM="Strombidium inclinatum, Strain S3" /LENGTH=122 /DNA_ID=CAMNT_0010781731 /DNA_START=310 /DNA_END=678 /DNA_ORIENTATION=-
MTMQGMHLNDELIDYLDDAFLQYACTNENVTFTESTAKYPPVMQRWFCPCSMTDVDGMPEITLSLQGVQVDGVSTMYVFGQKEYFIYPYYAQNTLPSNCRMSISRVLNSTSTDGRQSHYIFG